MRKAGNDDAKEKREEAEMKKEGMQENRVQNGGTAEAGIQGKGRKRKKIRKIILIVLILLFVIFSAVSMVIVKHSFDEIFGRTSMGDYSAYLRYEDVEDQYDRELLSFMSGENKLQGYLYGTGNEKGLVVISHGLGGGAVSYLSETLYFVDHGYQVFGYDNTGCHGSEGENCIGLPQSVIDLDAALTYIEQEERFTGMPVFLYGHSWGGYAVTAILNYDHEIAATASVAGFNKPMTMIMEWGENMMGAFARVEYPYIYLYQKLLFGDKLNLTAVDGINSCDTPVLIIHGSEDTTVGYDGAGTIAYRDEITNPNVQYKICDSEKQNDHNRLFQSLESIAYAEEVNEAYHALYEQYDGEIPEDVAREFCAGTDKAKMSEVDEAFMQDVLDFYENAVK